MQAGGERFAGIGDEAVREKTGRSWSEWVAALDREGGRDLETVALSRLLEDRFDVHATSASKGARQHRDRWSGLTAASGGMVRQRSTRKGQRASKRHPVNCPAASGTDPSIAASTSRWASRRGSEPSRPTV